MSNDKHEEGKKEKTDNEKAFSFSFSYRYVRISSGRMQRKNDIRITVISREEGSGTRGAFIDLFGIEKKNADGAKEDHTAATAEVSSSTAEILTTVAGNKTAIGYVSLGFLNDTVKAVKIDGVEAAADNINNGTYTISRPFNIATKGNLSNAAADFISFILSAEGQKAVADKGYIAIQDTGAFTGTTLSGKIVVAGSSSVSSVMEKLIEAYKTINPNVAIELQESDSFTGMNSVLEGSCDSIGHRLSSHYAYRSDCADHLHCGQGRAQLKALPLRLGIQQ